MGIKVVEEDEYGLYVWYTDDNLRVEDEYGNIMNIPSKKYDLKKIAMLREAARAHGVQGGKPVFLSGRRQVTQSEYEDQFERLNAGLVPDPLDYRAQEEEIKYARKHGN